MTPLSSVGSFSVAFVPRQFLIAFSLLAAIALLSASSARAQTTQELQQQIQQMKQLYEQQIAALEGRITSLEQANRALAHATQENVVSVTDLKSEVDKQVDAHEAPKLSRAEKTEIEQTELANTPQYNEIQDSEQLVRELEAASETVRVPRLSALGTGPEQASADGRLLGSGSGCQISPGRRGRDLR